jgi:hypothetical protein
MRLIYQTGETWYNKNMTTTEQVAQEVPPAGGEDEGQEAALSPEPERHRPSGWCNQAPMWVRAHLNCAARRVATVQCSCKCHEESWVRPEIPEGAQLSRYNELDTKEKKSEAGQKGEA